MLHILPNSWLQRLMNTLWERLLSTNVKILSGQHLISWLGIVLANNIEGNWNRYLRCYFVVIIHLVLLWCACERYSWLVLQEGRQNSPLSSWLPRKSKSSWLFLTSLTSLNLFLFKHTTMIAAAKGGLHVVDCYPGLVSTVEEMRNLLTLSDAKGIYFHQETSTQSNLKLLRKAIPDFFYCKIKIFLMHLLFVICLLIYFFYNVAI